MGVFLGEPLETTSATTSAVFGSVTVVSRDVHAGLLKELMCKCMSMAVVQPLEDPLGVRIAKKEISRLEVAAKARELVEELAGATSAPHVIQEPN